ncbi:MAG: winged helix-turn-helix transcriptional regulator [Candidatus Izemoplasmatales bacterium]
MSNNSFFKPTPLYKEFMILDLIEKNKNITQREMSIAIGSAVSMVNNFIDEYEQKGYIKRKYLSTKTVEYFVTKNGKERRKLLNIWYFKSSQIVYQSAKDNIISFLNQIIERGFKKILLYGAGEVAEIMLQVIQSDDRIPLQIVAVVDDNPNKSGEIIVNKKIISNDQIADYQHDGILISSYTHHKSIHEKLLKKQYDVNKIIQFFD